MAAPLYFSASEEEQIKYYLTIGEGLPKEFPIYVRNIPKLCSSLVSRRTLERMRSVNSSIAGFIDGSTDGIRMLGLTKDRDYALLTDCEAVFEIARLLQWDGEIG